MAQVGTITLDIDSPELLVGTWAIAATAANGDNSPVVNFKGYDFVEWFISTYTGYASGSHTVGLSIESDSDGLISADSGRSMRAIKGASTNLTGYLWMPPPTAYFITTVVATGPVTATTVKFIAQRTGVRPPGR